MRRTISKSGLSQTFGIASIVLPMVVDQILVFIVGESLFYYFFVVASFGLILAIVGLTLSRLSMKKLDNQTETVQAIVFAKTGKICSIIGLCNNLFAVIQIVYTLTIYTS